MSDDLERAAIAMNRYMRETPATERVSYAPMARAALLSFLDMDEAGKERLARALHDAAARMRGLKLWDEDDGSAPAKAIYRELAAAGVAELRIMAGGCAHERVDHNGECLDCDEPT